MTNKLKKEIEELIDDDNSIDDYLIEIENIKKIDFKKDFKKDNSIQKGIAILIRVAELKGYEQALSYQKQEDDERFEEFIKKLKKEVLENKDKETNISAIGTYGFFLDRIDKFAEELKSKLNGEKETFEEHIKNCGCCDDRKERKLKYGRTY